MRADRRQPCAADYSMRGRVVAGIPACRQCMNTPLVSIVIVVYNAAPFVSRLIAALNRQTYRNTEIIFFDNASTDHSAALIERAMPHATLIRSETNLGYAAGNNAALAYCHGTYIAILNPDTEPEPDWLTPLVATLEADPTVGLTTAKIVLDTDRETINTCGNEVHLVGFATCRGLGAPRSSYADDADVAAVSGAAFVIRRELMDRLGGFDTTFYMYVEDTDLSWRAMLLGARCRYVAASVVAHRYMLTLGADKTFALERNRLQMIIKCYRARTLFLLVPALVLGELAAWGYATVRGPAHLRAKAASVRWIFQHRHDLLYRRRQVQASRIVGDQALIVRATSRLPIALIQSGPIIPFAARCVSIPFAILRHGALAFERRRCSVSHRAPR